MTKIWGSILGVAISFVFFGCEKLEISDGRIPSANISDAREFADSYLGSVEDHAGGACADVDQEEFTLA